MFIDLWNSAAGNYGTFNEDTGFFELNGITDITYQEAIVTYNRTAFAAINISNISSVFAINNADIEKYRTTLPVRKGIAGVGGVNLLSLAYDNVVIKSIRLFNSNDIIYASSINYMLNNANSLEFISSVIYLNNINSAINSFEKAYMLKDIRLNRLKINLSFISCSLLSESSILYMINNEAATSNITITLHPDAYARAMANADIVAALEAHPNVSLASA